MLGHTPTGRDDVAGMIRKLAPLVMLVAAGCASAETLSIPTKTYTTSGAPVVPRGASVASPGMSLLTYNVNFGLAGDPATVEAIAAADADVVLLQETNEAWEEALREALAYPHMEFHHCCRAGGLAILSKHPLRPRRVLHPELAWFPSWRVDVDTPIGTLQTLNVHLRPNASDSGSVAVGLFTTPRIRRAEMETYVEALDPELPTIVAGDFNEAAGGALRVLAQRGLRRVAPTGRTATWRWTTSLGEIDATLDHVVIGGELVARRAEVLRVGRSDHLPVVVELARP